MTLPDVAVIVGDGLKNVIKRLGHAAERAGAKGNREKEKGFLLAVKWISEEMNQVEQLLSEKDAEQLEETLNKPNDPGILIGDTGREIAERQIEREKAARRRPRKLGPRGLGTLQPGKK